MSKISCYTTIVLMLIGTAQALDTVQSVHYEEATKIALETGVRDEHAASSMREAEEAATAHAEAAGTQPSPPTENPSMVAHPNGAPPVISGPSVTPDYTYNNPPFPAGLRHLPMHENDRPVGLYPSNQPRSGGGAVFPVQTSTGMKRYGEVLIPNYTEGGVSYTMDGALIVPSPTPDMWCFEHCGEHPGQCGWCQARGYDRCCRAGWGGSGRRRSELRCSATEGCDGYHCCVGYIGEPNVTSGQVTDSSGSPYAGSSYPGWR